MLKMLGWLVGIVVGGFAVLVTIAMLIGPQDTGAAGGMGTPNSSGRCVRPDIEPVKRDCVRDRVYGNPVPAGITLKRFCDGAAALWGLQKLQGQGCPT